VQLEAGDTLAYAGSMKTTWATEPMMAVIGGSGFYDLPGITDIEERFVPTPFGSPSDAVRLGRLNGRKVAFLARHGRDHTLLPNEVNSQANIYALKVLGATHILSVSAVGSLRENIAPGDVVLPHQFIDRTVDRPRSFFGQGVVAHIAFADPICLRLSGMMETAARSVPGQVHSGGTYVCIEGPQFSTRAESELWRQWGATVVGMTNLPEARLAREAELCYATLALPSDYDCWRTHNEQVTAAEAFATLKRTVDRAKLIVASVLSTVDAAAPCSCHSALDAALVTLPASIGSPQRQRLAAILERRLKQG
jgi:5'-methylthioadenosine phosphorylase